MKKSRLSGLAGAALMLASSTAVLATTTTTPIDGDPSTPVSKAGITPYIISGENPGGNRTCAEVGLAFFGDANYYQFSSSQPNDVGGINYDKDTNSFDRPFPSGISVEVADDDTYVTFTSTFGIGAVIVKGGNDANVYVYDPQVTTDDGLASPPPNPTATRPAGLSNITFCWNPEPEPTTWCSPGFWRNNPLARDEVGIDLSAKYNALFDPDRSGDPSLLEVLLNPRVYGGAAGENVADLLSAADPRLNFEMGDETEGAVCPIPADASRR